MPDRPAVPASASSEAQVVGLAKARLWYDGSLEDWRDWRQRFYSTRSDGIAATGREGARVLAISSGSDKGAFSAGFLKGWSQSQKRPTFDIVTGVSTGALIAPFAFLGEGYDPHLAQLYTAIDAGNIFTPRPISGLLGGSSFANTKPLRELVELYADDDLLDRIAVEHRRGRRLLVQTTNLDAGRGVVWDMGAIAASDAPGKLALFHNVLIASASIPGLFPPVLIEVEGDGVRFKEMHVDGGTTASLFALPPAILFRETTDDLSAASVLTILYNGRLEPRHDIVEPRPFEIIGRALETSILEADRRSVRALNAFA